MWYVAGLIWIALIVGVFLVHQRRQRRRNAERTGKMEALLRDLKANPGAGSQTAAAASPAAVTPAGPEFSRKPRLLPQSTALLYYVFRTGLPDHEIFAGHTLADVLDIAPALAGPRREEMRRKLAQQNLDLVVCTKQLEVVAVVITRDAALHPHADSSGLIAQCLQTAGIRLLSVDPAAPPRHHEVRALVYN